jgi:hypothetical protein
MIQVYLGNGIYSGLNVLLYVVIAYVGVSAARKLFDLFTD